MTKGRTKIQSYSKEQEDQNNTMTFNRHLKVPPVVVLLPTSK